MDKLTKLTKQQLLDECHYLYKKNDKLKVEYDKLKVEYDKLIGLNEIKRIAIIDADIKQKEFVIDKLKEKLYIINEDEQRVEHFVNTPAFDNVVNADYFILTNFINEQGNSINNTIMDIIEKSGGDSSKFIFIYYNNNDLKIQKQNIIEI